MLNNANETFFRERLIKPNEASAASHSECHACIIHKRFQKLFGVQFLAIIVLP
jgi:hypothetical protein